MIAIARHGTGFRLTISEPGTDFRGYHADATGPNETEALENVIKGVRHYYGCQHVADANCPLCRLVEKKRKRRVREG